MVHAFTIEPLWLFSCTEEHHGFPGIRHRYCQDQSSPTPGVSKKVIWCVSIALGPYSSFYLCSPRLSISLILDLIALPPSPTSPSPTQASSPAPTLSMAKLIMHRHVRIAFFSFPFDHLAHISSSFSFLFFPDDAYALNPPCIIASAAGASTHPSPYCCVNLRPSFSLSPNTNRCPISFVHGR